LYVVFVGHLVRPGGGCLRRDCAKTLRKLDATEAYPQIDPRIFLPEAADFGKFKREPKLQIPRPNVIM
jgi:hypothetical protein